MLFCVLCRHDTVRKQHDKQQIITQYVPSTHQGRNHTNKFYNISRGEKVTKISNFVKWLIIIPSARKWHEEGNVTQTGR